MVPVPALLPSGTAIFVLVVARASGIAIAIAKLIRYYISGYGRAAFDSSYLQKVVGLDASLGELSRITH
jgi:hypothetical protein